MNFDALAVVAMTSISQRKNKKNIISKQKNLKRLLLFLILGITMALGIVILYFAK